MFNGNIYLICCVPADGLRTKCNQTGNVRIAQHWGAFVQPVLQWKNNK